MDKVNDLIHSLLAQEENISFVFSSARTKEDGLRSIHANRLKDNQGFKVEYRLEKHNDIKTIAKDTFLKLLFENFLFNFKQILIKTESESHQVLINKKNKATIISKKEEKKKERPHNRKKNYLIPEGIPCDFMIAIGVMDKKGNVKSNFYKKFKQINRFLEMVDDLYKDDQLDKIHAVDFGCGKSYLTFALYHYFKNIRNFETFITGIDLKQEVIDHCNEIAQRLHFEGLKFVHGFIHDFKTDHPVDFVVTLHACDTATDDAILFSLKHQAKKMIFVPCCQHELNKQLQNKANKMLIESGIFRDRMCSLITDTARAKILEAQGYKVQIMEFIDMEHTAKNIMLRCQFTQKSEGQKSQALLQYQNFAKEWSITPYLAKQIGLH